MQDFLCLTTDGSRAIPDEPYIAISSVVLSGSGYAPGGAEYWMRPKFCSFSVTTFARWHRAENNLPLGFGTAS